jgi:5,10-methylenetetrahydromethanopterin reductase
VTPATGVWFFPDASAEAIVETVVAAERAGIDEVWLGDEGPARDPFALLAAAAGPTSTIRLGIAVTNPYARHPALTASTALTINELSDGRMMLGVGAGGDLALGPLMLERTRPLAAVERALRIIRAVSQGDTVEGYAPVAHAIEPSPLPLYIGARGERLNRLASTAADGVFAGGVPASVLGETLGWARSVRPLTVAVFVNAVFDEDAFEAARPQLVWVLRDSPMSTQHRLGLDPGDLERAAKALGDGEVGPARALISDEILDDLVLHGSPEQVGRSLAQRLSPHRPDTIGLSVLTQDPGSSIPLVAEALAVATRGWS